MSTNWGATNDVGSDVGLFTFRACGGTSPNTSGMTLQKVYVKCNGVTGTVRVAVYSGGALSDPTGAMLLEDLGQLTPPLVTAFTPINSTTHPTIPANAPLWIAVKGHDGSVSIYISNNSADAGDFQTARGRAVISGATNDNDETLAFPATLDGSPTFADFWPSWYLTYDVAAAGNNLFLHAIGEA